MRTLRLTALLLLSAFTLSTAPACKSRRGEQLRSGALFERIDKKDGVHKIANKVVAAVKADATLSATFANVDMARFEARLADFLCHASGGPCEFAGPLSDVWQGATLDQEGFEALMEVMVTGMTDANLPQQEQNDLLDLMMKANEGKA